MAESDTPDTTPPPERPVDVPVSDTAAAPESDTTARPATPRPARKDRGGIYIVGAIGLVAFAGLLYHDLELKKSIDVVFGEYNRLNQARAADQAQLADTLQQTRQQLEAAVQEQLRADQDATAAQAAQLDALNRDLVALRLRVNDNGSGAGGAWRLTEAESLLRFAGQRLVLARDVRTALGLALAADDLLKQINDPAVFTVREALALDIAALQAVDEVDTAGLHARLGAVIEGVDGLVVQPGGPEPVFRAPEPAVTDAASDASWWDSTLDTLGQYFVVTRDAEESIPQLTAEQTWVVKETVKLRLEQARVALLRGQAGIYQAALQQAHDDIDALLQGERRAALLDELAALRNAPIQTVVPPATLGLDALRQLQPAGTITP